MKNKLLIVVIAIIAAIGLSSCATKHQRLSAYNRTNTVRITAKPKQTYDNLTFGLEVKLVLTEPEHEISEDASRFNFSGRSFFTAPTMAYVRSMGLIEMSARTDYKLEITIKRAEVYSSNATSTAIDSNAGNSWVTIDAVLYDSHNEEAFAQRNISTSANGLWNTNLDFGQGTTYSHTGLDKAYTQALEQINWNRIASFLRTEQLPKDEPNKQVQGLGDTALEQTIVRWDIQSRPQGADIFWRVVSKTPEVKSTNNKYLQTTPYEATKSLDIKGLTYQTSGDVRIVLRCEKDGYHPQEKEYNVRMVIDQEEISAFFRLVKEE